MYHLRIRVNVSQNRFVRLAGIAVLMALAFGVGSFTSALGDATPDTYSACLRETNVRIPGTLQGLPRNGSLYNVTVNDTPRCLSADRLISWNAQGPVGLPGATGPVGATGPKGDTGPAGPNGAIGAMFSVDAFSRSCTKLSGPSYIDCAYLEEGEYKVTIEAPGIGPFPVVAPTSAAGDSVALSVGGVSTNQDGSYSAAILTSSLRDITSFTVVIVSAGG